MALVRVYCGLASAYPPRQLAVGSSSLSATVVDDAGRVLDTCDIGDDPYGYAYLSALLAERASGPYSVAIAADSDQQLVSQLLITAGWSVALVDPANTDEYLRRFGEDLTGEEEQVPNQRRALGLARALQAGAISATLLPPPTELAELKPALAAHNALATGRHAAAMALREVLRELYPAALRAYSDPADPVALAVLAELPEPGMVPAPSWDRDNAGPGAVADRITAAGDVDRAAVTEAINALQAAVAEAPRRGGPGRAFATVTRDAVREVVGAVRAYDTSSTALVGALAEQTAGRLNGADTGAGRRRAGESANEARTGGQWRTAESEQPAPHTLPTRTPRSGPPGSPQGRSDNGQAADRPMSPVPPPPPGITPIAEQPGPTPPDRQDGHFDRQPRVPTPRPTPDRPPRGTRADWPTGSSTPDRPGGRPEWDEPAEAGPVGQPGGYRPTGQPDRAGWQSGDAQPSGYRSGGRQFGEPPPGEYRSGEYPPVEQSGGQRGNGPSRAERRRQAGATPPWQSDDLEPPESPGLRLVEPESRERPEQRHGPDQQSGPPVNGESPNLRLVDPGGGSQPPRSVPPVSADDDDNLLIFSQIRSAWFDQDQEASWDSAMDAGWQAAEQAAKPRTGDRTQAGLPRRVPHANLVPGAPPKNGERQLRVVRDPETIAAHTSGYFNGWRRGQEVGGFPVGNRPARRTAGAWEFHRDEDRLTS